MQVLTGHMLEYILLMSDGQFQRTSIESFKSILLMLLRHGFVFRIHLMLMNLLNVWHGGQLVVLGM